MEAGGHRVLSVERWRQYIVYFYPGVRLSRSKEDVCDACMRIELQLCDESLTPEARAALELQKRTHLEASKGWRRAMGDFVKQFVSREAPAQILPALIVEEELLVAAMDALVIDEPPILQVTAEDFGGSLTMPHYGFRRRLRGLL